MEEQIVNIISDKLVHVRTTKVYDTAKEITTHIKQWVQWYFSKGQFAHRFSNLEESYQYWNENIYTKK